MPICCMTLVNKDNNNNNNNKIPVLLSLLYQHPMYLQELLVYCIWFLSFCFCDCTIVVFGIRMVPLILYRFRLNFGSFSYHSRTQTTLLKFNIKYKM